MKKPNSISDFSDQRNELLLSRFRESLARQSKISAERAFRDAVEAPMPRFWVSEDRATEVISKMMSDIDFVNSMLPEKREMYLEIYKRVKSLKSVYPEMPLCQLVFRVVNQSAPRSYITWSRAKKLINRLRFS